MNGKVPVRARCTKCQATRLVEIERQGDVILPPARIVHICGNVMRVLSPDMKKFFAASADDL